MERTAALANCGWVGRLVIGRVAEFGVGFGSHSDPYTTPKLAPRFDPRGPTQRSSPIATI
jgi:hypothetical protein